MLGNRDDAEDIVQGLFADLLKKKKYDESLPYLYRAATNRCLNLMRNRKKRRNLLAQSAVPAATAGRTLLEERVVGSELLSRLVGKLDKKSAEILVYKYVDDLTQEEIADMMRLSRRTIGKKLKRISEEARKFIDDEKGDRP
jgi:RNA polymerase sigma-70 factor (ECF subfamily)